LSLPYFFWLHRRREGEEREGEGGGNGLFITGFCRERAVKKEGGNGRVLLYFSAYRGKSKPPFFLGIGWGGKEGEGKSLGRKVSNPSCVRKGEKKRGRSLRCTLLLSRICRGKRDGEEEKERGKGFHGFFHPGSAFGAKKEGGKYPL